MPECWLFVVVGDGKQIFFDGGQKFFGGGKYFCGGKGDKMAGEEGVSQKITSIQVWLTFRRNIHVWPPVTIV